MIAAIWAANVLGWPLIQLSIGYVALRLPADLFMRDTWLTAPRQWERGGSWYREVVAVRAWKSSIPDGAAWLGGFAKMKMYSRDPAYLARFLIETRRSELAHWCMFCGLPIFFLWNPPWACCVMTAYALAANLPCILVQRYNRLVLGRVFRTRRRARECV